MPPGGHLYNIWQQEDHSNQIDVSCLLPTGILIILRCPREQTITSIKTVRKYVNIYKRFLVFCHEVLVISIVIFFLSVKQMCRGFNDTNFKINA